MFVIVRRECHFDVEDLERNNDNDIKSYFAVIVYHCQNSMNAISIS